MGGVNLNFRAWSLRTSVSLEMALRGKGSDTSKDLARRLQTRETLESVGRTIAASAHQVKLFEDREKVTVELASALTHHATIMTSESGQWLATKPGPTNRRQRVEPSAKTPTDLSSRSSRLLRIWTEIDKLQPLLMEGDQNAARRLADIILENKYFGEPLLLLQKIAGQHPAALIELCDLYKRAKDPETRIMVEASISGVASMYIGSIVEQATKNSLAVEALATVSDILHPLDFGISDILRNLNVQHHAVRVLGHAARFGNITARAKIEALAKAKDPEARLILDRLIDNEERVRAPLLGTAQRLGDGSVLLRFETASSPPTTLSPEVLAGEVTHIISLVKAAEKNPKLFRPLIDLDYSLRHSGRPSPIPDLLRSCNIDALAREANQGDREAFMDLLTLAIRYRNEAAMRRSAAIFKQRERQLEQDGPLLKAMQTVRVRRLITATEGGNRNAETLLKALAKIGNEIARAFLRSPREYGSPN